MTTITATQAYEAILEHHKRLGEELTGRAEAVSGEFAAGRPHGTAVAGLVAYLAEEVLPHAAAEEEAIYPAAARAGLAGTVAEMIAEHAILSALGTKIATLTDGESAARQARQIASLFTAHAAKENDVLLPALLADESVDLAGLLAQMHHHPGHVHEDLVLDVRDLAPARRCQDDPDHAGLPAGRLPHRRDPRHPAGRAGRDPRRRADRLGAAVGPG